MRGKRFPQKGLQFSARQQKQHQPPQQQDQSQDQPSTQEPTSSLAPARPATVSRQPNLYLQGINEGVRPPRGLLSERFALQEVYTPLLPLTDKEVRSPRRPVFRRSALQEAHPSQDIAPQKDHSPWKWLTSAAQPLTAAWITTSL